MTELPPPTRPRQRGVPLWLALAWRESTANRAFTLGFVLNLSLGLIGFLTIDAFKGSIHAHLDGSSKRLLGGDLVVSGRREITPDEQEQLTRLMPPGSEMRSELRLMSMVVNPVRAAAEDGSTATRLVELRAIDRGFPFYGEPVLRRQGRLSAAAPRDVLLGRNAWVAPELLTQLGLTIGSPLKIGSAEFTVTDVVEHDPTAGSDGLEIAPKVFIGADFMAETALLDKGSRVARSLLLRLPESVDADQLAKDVKASLSKSDLRVKSHRQASEDLNRALLYLNDYLGLVALVALFLAGVGGAYLFRSFLARRARDIAILLSLGLPLAHIRRIYVTQLAFLGLATTALTGVLAALLLPLLPRALGPLLPAGMQPTLSSGSLASVLVLGTGGSLLFCLPLLARLADLKPATLFQEDGQSRALDARLSVKQVGAWLPALVAYWLMAVAQSRSLVIGSLFVCIFLVALLLFALAGLGFTKLLGRRPAKQNFVLEMAALSLARHRAATITSFVALGLGSLLVNLVPQIRGVVSSELTEPPGGKRPSLFLFDIQAEQQAGLESALVRAEAPLAFISPMVRARLIGINGEVLKDGADGSLATREDEEERRALNRGYNLSYRGALSSSEELVDGRAFSGSYGGEGPAEMSLELRFAERLGLGLGDRMTFEVQGVPVEGVVVNTRRVRWTSFQPNFFVQFQPGVLEDAPKTLVAAVPDVADAKKLELQTKIVQAFPNVSIIDVTATVERLLGIVEQMGLAIYLMAVLSLVAGLAVLFAIAHHQAQRRIPDVTLLKILGTDFPRLRLMALVEFGLLGVAAAGLGAILSVAAAFVLAYVAFDRLWVFDWQTPVALGVLLATVCTLTGVVAVSRSLKGKPAALLGAARFS